MYCDSAFYNTRTNIFKAFGNIQLIKVSNGDTIFLSSDSLRYHGDTKLAEIRGNVVLKQDTTILFTDSLNYDAANDIAYYQAWAKTISGKDTLISDVGYYYSRTADIFLKGNVKIFDPRYTITTDTLRYNLNSETAYFFGPT
jgi:lipopolysaccharide export system protein LptA